VSVLFFIVNFDSPTLLNDGIPVETQHRGARRARQGAPNRELLELSTGEGTRACSLGVAVPRMRSISE
jgi:hypothetical protein